ncbi:MAG: hypothetical protein SGARI_001451 [Bacillariaceae sp.]
MSRTAHSLDDGRLEIAIRTRIKEKVKIDELTMKRQLTYGLQKAISDSNFTWVEGYLRNTFGLKVIFEGRNNTQTKGNGDAVDTSILDNVTTAETPLVPMWVPSVFLPYIISSNASTVGPTEVEIMEKNVLSGSRFYVTSSDTVAGAALFRGNIRSKLGQVIVRTIKTEDADDDDDDEGGVDNTTAVVFAEIQERMEAAGLGDKVQLFMMTDPDTEPKMKGTRPAVTAMEEDTKPTKAK